MHYEILDKKRLDILPLLSNFKEDFYLAGGIGLALEIGHRDSVDFDFFTDKQINTQELYYRIMDIFKNHKIEKVQEEKNTLSVIIDSEIKLSFFHYPYQIIEKLVEDEYFRMASIIDIACMKLSAIVGRSVLKDYIDIYFILQQFDLNDILVVARRKMPDLEENLILKSLIYFEDVTLDKIIFKNSKDVSFEKVKDFLIRIVKGLGR